MIYKYRGWKCFEIILNIYIYVEKIVCILIYVVRYIDENVNFDVVVFDFGVCCVVVVDKYGIFRFNYLGNM